MEATRLGEHSSGGAETCAWRLVGTEQLLEGFNRGHGKTAEAIGSARQGLAAESVELGAKGRVRESSCDGSP